MELVHARARRRMSRGLKRKPMALIKRLRKAKKSESFRRFFFLRRLSFSLRRSCVAVGLRLSPGVSAFTLISVRCLARRFLSRKTRFHGL